MKPAFITLGKTATHSAFANRSRGIALSGFAMISVNTRADFAAWLAPSLGSGPRSGREAVCGLTGLVVFGFALLYKTTTLPAITRAARITTPRRVSFSPFMLIF